MTPGYQQRVHTLAEIEKRYITDVSRKWKLGKELLAKALGISRATLYRRLNEYGLIVAPVDKPDDYYGDGRSE